MRAVITKDNIEAVFRQKVNEKGAPSINDALQLVVDFYNGFEIKDVDSSVSDNDMLLFEYGVYDWNDGKGENYTVDFTRQFYIENKESEGFSQLHLILYFDKEKYKKIEAASKWSIDFNTTEEWSAYIINSEGFRLAEGEVANAYDIFLSETD